MKVKIKVLGMAVFMLVVLMGSASLWAKDSKKEDKSAPVPAGGAKVMTPEETQAELEKQVLINNISDLKIQDTKVRVLGDLYNQELVSLRQKQAFFCDLYKLDVEKFRKNLYQYDERAKKFIERAPEQAQQIGT